mgnify:FL=1
MKMKIQMLAMLFIAAMVFGACSDDDKNDNITAPDAISKAFKEKYPAATDVEWERKGNFFVADCWMDGREMDVWFDTQAVWQLTEVNISWEGLPAAVQTAFNTGEYANWKREDIDMLQYPVEPVQYVIEVEKGNMEYQLFYDQSGNLLDQKDVSGDKDDTHWP